ncbi:unnamed protein product [Rhizoctonia solani]|uniref:Uncharacterized protein n=1 Tax=Rhizoctonia solani TaxID=456999 RepID=A0A8H2WI59_9AGAM|nr:unnamed protein product [Rhizoctonia solani]
MNLIASVNGWESCKDDSAAKFIVIRPDIEPKSPELPSTSSGECPSPDTPRATFPSQDSTYFTSSVYDFQSEDVGYDQTQSQLLLEQPSYPQLHDLRGSHIVASKEILPAAQPLVYTTNLDLASHHPSETSGSPNHGVHARWDRLAVLFRSVHEHAQSFEYPHDALGELEDVLIRLYFGSNHMGEEFSSDQQSVGFDTIGRSPLGESCANRNEKQIQPDPTGNLYLPASELSKQEASHVWDRPNIGYSY